MGRWTREEWGTLPQQVETEPCWAERYLAHVLTHTTILSTVVRSVWCRYLQHRLRSVGLQADGILAGGDKEMRRKEQNGMHACRCGGARVGWRPI